MKALRSPNRRERAPRPILVRFSRPSDREDIWRTNARLADLNSDQFAIKEDLPVQLRPIMAALVRVAHTARNITLTFEISKFISTENPMSLRI